MTQDESIELARQAGLLPCQGIHMGDLKAFAKLVEQRTWVGLTHEEIDGIIEDSIDKVDALIQTMDKLKDKNT
jgi:hypothetical protein